MTGRPRTDPRTDLSSELRPGNAAAVILTVEGRYLLQLRDSRPDIFFPAQWGCFGGATEAGETPEQTLIRELREELDLTVPAGTLRHFTRFDFDLHFAGLPTIWRHFFELSLSSADLHSLRLNEGQEFRTFVAEDILTAAVPITPYDAFALWFHINRRRLRA